MVESSNTQKKKKEKYKKNKYAKWKAVNRYRYHDPKLWKPGQPLTEEDELMLDVVRSVSRRLGYSPAQKQVPNLKALRRRFRIWRHVLLAAGLPDYNSPEQNQKRIAAKEWERRMKELVH